MVLRARSMKLRIAALAFLLALAVCVMAQNVPALLDRPGGLVHDQQAALRIVEVVLVPIYGGGIMCRPGACVSKLSRRSSLLLIAFSLEFRGFGRDLLWRGSS
jgi:hypothetical protein